MRNGGVKVSSSPRREKFPEPPGLARLLYGKAVDSRSRGRTTFVSARSSPIFVSRSRSRGRSSSAGTAAAAVVVEGEPSSPKVTCIGQVRIRSKRKTLANKERSKSSSPPAPCRCLPKVLLRKIFPVREKPRSGGGGRRRSLWRRWACIRSGRSGRKRWERERRGRGSSGARRGEQGFTAEERAPTDEMSIDAAQPRVVARCRTTARRRSIRSIPPWRHCGMFLVLRRRRRWIRNKRSRGSRGEPAKQRRWRNGTRRGGLNRGGCWCYQEEKKS